MGQRPNFLAHGFHFQLCVAASQMPCLKSIMSVRQSGALIICLRRPDFRCLHFHDFDAIISYNFLKNFLLFIKSIALRGFDGSIECSI